MQTMEQRYSCSFSGLFIPPLANKLHGDEPLMKFMISIHDHEYFNVASNHFLTHTHTQSTVVILVLLRTLYEWAAHSFTVIM